MKRKRQLVWLGLALVCCGGKAFALSGADFQTAANDEGGGVTITRYTGWDKDITIPAVIGGKAVTAIGKEAFKSADLTGVVIPDSVKTIGEWAFSGNKLLKLTLGKGVTVVGDGAFSGSQLTSLAIGNNVTIGSSAFSGSPLTSLAIGDNVTVGWDAFSGSPLTNLTIGNNVYIEGYAFDDNELASVTLGANMSWNSWPFGSFAYYSYLCNGLKAGTYRIDANWRLESNSREAEGFTYAETPYGLVITGYRGDSKRLEIPAALEGKPVKCIGDLSKKGLTGLRIPDGVAAIGDSAFPSNQLTNVAIGSSVAYMGDGAFQGNQLTSVVIPDSVTYIGREAFYGNQLTSVTIGSGVTRIGHRAFCQNQLTSITIPDSVTYIGEDAFAGNQLTSVIIPANVTPVGGGAFYKNRPASVTSPANVTLGNMSNLVQAGWALSVGFIPLSSVEIGGVTPHYNTTFVQTAEAGFTIAGMFRVFTTIEIRETKAESFYFDPYRADFKIGAEFLYKDLVLGITHECNHDIVTNIELNQYNGWDAAFCNVYGGWFWKFPVHQDIMLKPSVFLGIRPYDNLYLKYNTRQQYFAPGAVKQGHSSNAVYVRAGIDSTLFGFLNFHCSLQPDFSLNYGRFSRFEINIGLEYNYYNFAAGAECINQIRLDASDYAVKELKIYIAFRGKSFLFSKDQT